MRSIKLALVFICLISTSAFCGVLIEPYVGYLSVKNSGTVEVFGMEADLEETTAKGMGFGGRLGYGVGNIALGLDYMTANLDDDGDDTKLTNIAGFATVNLALLRLWAGYIFSSELEIDSDDLEGTIDGSGYKVGLGFSILPKVSLNFEYLMLNYDKEDSDLLTAIDQDSKGFMVSLSFPFVF